MYERFSASKYHRDYVTKVFVVSLIFLTTFLLLYIVLEGSNDTHRIVCYFTYNQSTVFNQNTIDAFVCTHLILGFVFVSNGEIQLNSFDLQIFKEVIKLKDVNKDLKIILSVQEISSYGEFSNMVASDELRHKFVNTSLDFLKKKGFDGIDLDWEFPSWPNQNLIQVQNFTLLLKQMRDEINNKYEGFILSVAVGAPQLLIEQCYEISEIAKFVNFVNLMSYDYFQYTASLPITGPNAPLYHKSQEPFHTFNINWSANEWVRQGMPKKQINIGIPTFGHSYRLVNEDNNAWYAPANGYSIGFFGFTTFPDTCHMLSQKNTIRVFDEDYMIPYAYNGKQWVSYEDKISVTLKASYIRDNNYGGAMIYNLNNDDVFGLCNPIHKFPLTQAVRRVLKT